MQKIAFILFTIFVLTSCQTATPSGNEIVFTDVIGNYDGECADYTNSTSELMNREESTLSVIAATLNSAGINTSCDRILDQSIPVKTASAEMIVFEKNENDDIIKMTYYAQEDSIVIIQTIAGETDNLIFTGKRN